MADFVADLRQGFEARVATDEGLAADLYRALCGNVFLHNDGTVFHTDWQGASRIIATLRAAQEDPDWLVSGGEGRLTDEILDGLTLTGWRLSTADPHPLQRLTAQTEVAVEVLGHQGRLLTYSKSGYWKRFPDNLFVANSGVCTSLGALWWGDFDATLEEQKLHELAGKLNTVVYLLYEGDREAPEGPRLSKALLQVAPGGQTSWDYRYLSRDTDGQLRRRPAVPVRRRRWDWRVLRHRPTLLRFWVREHKTNCDQLDGTRSDFLYLGERSAATPLLVYGLHRQPGWRALGLEATFYPCSRPRRNAPDPLACLRPKLRLGRLTLYLVLLVHPAYHYELRTGYWHREPNR